MDLCFYECGRKATTKDHIITVEDGGAHHASNYVRACDECNSSRRHMPIAEFLALRGVVKDAPRGNTNTEYKLTTYAVEDLTIAVCRWCERPFVTLKRGVKGPQCDKSHTYCSQNHALKWRRKRRPRTGVN